MASNPEKLTRAGEYVIDNAEIISYRITGGGPGVGPIGVAAHLAEFLPGNVNIPTGGENFLSLFNGVFLT